MGARLHAALSSSAAARAGRRLDLGAAKFELETARHEGGDELVGASAQARDLAHHRCGEIGVLIVGHQEDGLDVLVEPAVEGRELELIVHVRDDAQAADQHTRLFLLQVVDEQAADGVAVHVRQAADGLLDHFDAFRDGECVLFGGVVRHGHDDMLEKLGGALDDIEMSTRQRIEAAGVDRDSAHDRSIPLSKALWRGRAQATLSRV